jgi:hypothetical protein
VARHGARLGGRGATARLGRRARRPAEPRGAAAPRIAVRGRAVAWWRARVVAPARRAWLAVVAGRRDTRRAGKRSSPKPHFVC